MADETQEQTLTAQPPLKLSIDDFAHKIKTKYPAYDKMDNKELVDKITAKYPQYKEQINFTTEKKSPNTTEGSSTGSNSSLDKNSVNLPTISSHDAAIGIAQQQRQTPKQPQPTKDKSILDRVSQALYLPAFNEGFNELVTKPMAGATDLIDRTIDKTYQKVTGEKTPDWLREGGFFKKLSDETEKAYAARDKPKNIISDTAEGVVGTLPLIASMFTGEGEVNMAPKLVSRMTKMLATTGAANAYKDATDKKEGYLQSLGSAATGAEKGATQGLTLDAQMLVAGALGKGVANKLAEKGLLKGGKAGEALIHALSSGTVFGGTSAGQDLLNGKDVDTHEAVKQFGTGLAFELIPVAKGINEEIAKKSTDKKALQTAALATSASNLNGESALRTLVTTPKDQLQEIATLPGSHEDLYAKSIEHGMKAYEEPDLNEKRALHADQLALKAQGDVKLIQSKLKDGAPEMIEQIENSDELPEDKKADLIDKIQSLIPKNEQTESNKEIPDETSTDETNGKEETANPTDETTKNNSPITTTTNDSNEKEGVAKRPANSSESQEKTVENEKGDAERNREKAGNENDEKGNVVKSDADKTASETTNQKGEESATKEWVIEKNNKQEHLGTAQGKDVSENEKEIREEKSEQTSGSDKPESSEETPKVTGIKKAIGENTRIQKKLPEVSIPKLGKEADILQRGKTSVESGAINPSEVVSRVANKGVGGHYDLEESEAMQYYAHQLANQERSYAEQLADVKEVLDKDPNNEKAKQDKILIESNRQQLFDAQGQKYIADRYNQNFWGKSGNILRIESDQNFSPANTRAEIAYNYDGTIPKDVEERLSKAEKERDEALSELKKAQENSIKKNGEKVIGKIREHAERKGIVKQTKAELEEEAKKLLTDLKKAFKADYSRVNSGIPLPTETIAVLGKLAVNYFKQGVKDFEGLTNKIFDDLKDDVEGLNKKEVREALSNYDPLREAAKDRELELLGRKERSANKQLETGKFRDYSRKPKIVFPKDNEVIKAEQRVIDAEYKIRREKEKSYGGNKNKYQRALDWIVRWERRSVLASPLILEKLASAATIGAAVNRIPKQLIGGAFSAIFKGLAEKAPIEGGLNMKAEMKFWKEFGDLKKLYESSKEILKTGASPLTKKFTDNIHEHHAGWDALMDTHAIIKDAPKRATYEASLQYAYEWAAKNKLDYQDPLVKRSLELAAFKRAEYEIFQENNGVAKRVHDFINSERKRNNTEATKQFLYRFLIPISTVPLNIARRIGSSIVGLPRGLYLTAEAYNKGIENLQPEQADYILRQLKNGSTGLAYYAFGMFASKAIMGGLWNEDDKKGIKSTKNQAAFNEMKPLGIAIDKRIQHAMPLFLMQLGATTARVYNHYMDVPTDDPEYQTMLKSGIQAMLATGGTVVEDIPMIQEPKQAVESLSDPYERKKFGQDLKRRVGFSILNDLGITKKDTSTPLDKKLQTVTDDDGDKVTLTKEYEDRRKADFQKEVTNKKNVKDWTDDFNDNWEESSNQKKISKFTTYWKGIGRSEKYINDKVDDMKQDALDKYIEKQALEASEKNLPDKARNNFTIRK